MTYLHTVGKHAYTVSEGMFKTKFENMFTVDMNTCLQYVTMSTEFLKDLSILFEDMREQYLKTFLLNA